MGKPNRRERRAAIFGKVILEKKEQQAASKQTMPAKSIRSSGLKAITAEKIATIITGALAFLNVVLPVIPFWWRLAFLLIFIVLTMDLCLRAENTKTLIPSPYGRLFLSIVVSGMITALFWTPMRRQYAEQNLPPSFPFIFGAPLGDNNSPDWLMMLHHFGQSPAYNCRLELWDLDRKNIEHLWREQNHNYLFSPPDIVRGESQKVVTVPEADALNDTGGSFEWLPLDPDRQHYTVSIGCRDGEFTETWNVTRVQGALRSEMKIERSDRWIASNPNLEKLIYSCSDREFESSPLLSSLPPPIPKEVNPGWKPNHRFEVPVVIIDPNNHAEIMSGVAGVPPEKLGCWTGLTVHMGNIVLPLKTPKRLSTKIIISAVLVIALIGYCLLALWVMNVPIRLRRTS
jgi:hypothetical protein